MCGIAGFLGRSAAEVSDEVLDRLGHRGPDGRGRFDSGCDSVSLFHTRLAILDPTPDGAQPMSTPDGQVTITFNGEIYNFPELRAELESRGYVFRSRTDTEVLLALYLQHGPDMLQKLNGIFAFGLWDTRSKSLLVARDGLGVKPLYICESAGTFAFASEIKALLCFPWVPRRIDPQALAHYIRYVWCPAPRTPLLDVKKLEPGEALIVRDGRIVRRWKYYSLPAPGPNLARSTDDWIGEVRCTLDQAVQRQMISDVPLGAFLSGGVDSTSIAYFARKYSTGKLQCFTIDFDQSLAKKEGFESDLPYAKNAAKQLDVDLHVVRVGSEMANGLSYMVRQLDEPLADFAALNVLFISQLARQHGIKVLLSGAGGDDVFTGYRRHRALDLDSTLAVIPSSLRRALEHFGHQLPHRSPTLRRVAKVLTAAAMEGDMRLAGYFEWASLDTVRKLFLPEIRETILQQPLLEALKAMPPTATKLQRMLLLEQRYFLADHNLTYTDKMCMAAGVEARVPYLDVDLVALASTIPDRLRQRGASGKWILKKAMEGLLPREIIHRTKTGFGVPLRGWLYGPLKPMLYDVLGTESLSKRGLFDPAEVLRLLREDESGRTDHAYSILSLICIELWCRNFIDQQLQPEAPFAVNTAEEFTSSYA